jgi:hypothetical protein
MAFDPISFVYQPPPTLPLSSAVLTATPATAASTSALGADGLPVAGTSARQIMGRLSDLSDTAAYLAQIIGERTASLAVVVDPALNPDVAQALGRIYSGNVPPGVSVAMYGHLVTAEMSMLRADIALAAATTSSQYQVSPLSRGDVQTVINHFESTLTDSNDFLSQLPPLIRGLAGEQVAFDNLQSAFAQYPGASGAVPASASNPVINSSLVANSTMAGATQSPGLQASLSASTDATADVSPALAAGVNQRLDVWQTYYAKTYDLTAGIDSAYADVQSINNKFIVQPVNLLLKVVAMLGVLLALFHKTSLDSIRKSIVWMVLPRLMSEVGLYATVLDRLVQKAVSPALQVINSLGQLFSQVARDVTQVAWLVDGGLTGAVRQQITGSTQKSSPPPAVIRDLNAAPYALKQVTANVSWAVNQVRTQSMLVQQSMFRIMDRSLGGSGNRLEALQSMRSITSLITICNSIISQLNTMTSGALGQQPSQTGSQIGTVVNSINQTGQQSMALSGNNLVLVGPSLSAPSPNVQTLLVAGGSAQINAANSLTVPLVTA